MPSCANHEPPMSIFGVTAAVARAPKLFLLFTSLRLSPCPLYAPTFSVTSCRSLSLYSYLRLAPTSCDRKPAPAKRSLDPRASRPWPAPRSIEGRLLEEVSSYRLYGRFSWPARRKSAPRVPSFANRTSIQASRSRRPLRPVVLQVITGVPPPAGTAEEVQVVATLLRLRPPSNEGWMYTMTFSEMLPRASMRARRL